MKLVKLAYTEFAKQPREWTLQPSEFGAINLIVGKNATGKTRLLNIINSLAARISNRPTVAFADCKFDFDFASSADKMHYAIQFSKNEVSLEKFVVGDSSVLERDESGTGVIFAVEIPDQKLNFKVPNSTMAAVAKRDEIQHPFLEPLHQWASSVRYYHFGKTLGQDTIMFSKGEYDPSQLNRFDENLVIETFRSGIDKHSDDFKNKILNDMGKLGYDIEDMMLTSGEVSSPLGQISSGQVIAVQEKGIEGYLTQGTLSQGMYRALALVIHLNFSEMENEDALLLIDDIGEGLDYDRSRELISLVIERAESRFSQVIMTSNDRFIMNAVPLKYWSVAHRADGNIRLINSRNSPEIFSQFEKIGLNNFDFFAREFYLEKE